ncbi:MAG: sigma-70 family RNA polymerase sigma factor [Planctomycetes bacterium]|nr:sigma-70 family RNA polymerase sigma factor [Planctomycetota bacterium]
MRNKMTTATEKFESLLESLKHLLFQYFRGLDAEAQEEAVAEGIAAAWENWVSLVARGREAGVTVHNLAWYAAKHQRTGRHVGGSLRTRDAYRLEKADGVEYELADERTDPAEAAAFRIDFAEWCATLTDVQRETAVLLLAGFTTREVARLLGKSDPAVSQMRTTLEASWIARFAEGG